MVHIEKPLDLNAQGPRKITAASATATAQGNAKAKNNKTVKKESEPTPTTTMPAGTTTPTSNKTGPKQDTRKPKVEAAIKAGGSGAGREQGTRTGRAKGEKTTGDAQQKRSVRHNTESSSSLSAASPAASTTAAGGQASTVASANDNTLAIGTAAATTQPPVPSTNRMAETSGMAPSANILLLRRAREAAKIEAQATGRRPRAPSRRALEASGRVHVEGAQWLTREKRAEQARVAAELRKRRKQYKEAGLKFGEVLEELVEPAAVVSDKGHNAGNVGVGGTVPGRGDPGRQKVSPVPRATAPQQHSITPGSGERPGKRAKLNSADTNA